jgi:spoIIIJ-associated protein
MEEYIQEILSNLLQALDVDYKHINVETKVESKQDEEDRTVHYVNIDLDNAGKIIGRHGENIGNISHILKLILKKKFDKIVYIKLDIDNYMQREKEKSIAISEKYIDKLEQTKKAQSLPPMSPYLRATVHTFIAENHPTITTESKGFGKFRYITINYK